MPAYCEVALPVPLDRTFTYAVRESQLPQRGARVIAPFRNEKLIGVVTALSTTAPADFEVRFLEAVLDDQPLLSDDLLALAEWMAQYYLAPLGEVLRGMLPLMAEVRRTVYYRITDLGRDVLAGALDGDSQASGSSGGGKRRGKLSAEPRPSAAAYRAAPRPAGPDSTGPSTRPGQADRRSGAALRPAPPQESEPQNQPAR